MRKVKEVRRLHYELRLGQRQIRPLLLDLSEHRPAKSLGMNSLSMGG